MTARKVTYVDVTPTWEGILPMLITLVRDGETAEARNTGWDELKRMAVLADAYVLSQREG